MERPSGGSDSGTTEGNATVRVNINERVLTVLAGALMFAATAAFQPVRSHLNPPDPPIVRGAPHSAVGPRAIVIVDPPGPGQGPKTSLNPGDPPVITH